MKTKKIFILYFAVLSLCMLSCAPADEDRCDNGQIYENESCIIITDSETDTSANSETDTLADSETDTSADSETDITDGTLGSTCKSDNNCNNEAPKCLMQPGKTKGYCTVDNCSLENNDCPKGYSCCELSGEADCLNNDDYNLMKTIGICK